MSQEIVLELQQVTKRIGSKTIIDRLSLQVPRGEVFGFLGPNGAGKTTTIRMMVGLMSITEGEILIGGHSIKRDFEKAVRDVGAIVENPEMYKYMSGYKNLIHYARMIPAISRERIDEVVDLVGLKNRIHDKVKTYSLGMRQRLGVAQALLHKPRLLVLDEPTNGLDPAGIREMRDYLRMLAREEQVAVLVSSHLLSEMELMCDRVAILQNGKLVDVRRIRDDAQTETMITVQYEVDDAAKAKELLAGTEWRLHPVDQEIVLTLPKEQLPQVNALLIGAGISLYTVKPVTQSLEDQFLEITGGEQIV